MTILIVNNYYKPKNRNNVDQITKMLEECGEVKPKVIDLNKISGYKIRDEIDAVILSGSSASLWVPRDLQMYEEEIKFIHRVKIPMLGICFGHQIIACAFGTEIKELKERISGFIEVEILKPNKIFSSWKKGEKIMVSQSHKDYISRLPKKFICLARSESCEIEAMKHESKPLFSIQAHIERISDQYTNGRQILKNFLNNVTN